MIKRLLSHRILSSISGVLIIVLIILGIYQVQLLHKAHSTFDNYYSFRGCVQLLKKTPTYGICKTRSGRIVNIVLYRGKWYLNGDLPIGFWGHLM